jgi:hypothetical protein
LDNVTVTTSNPLALLAHEWQSGDWRRVADLFSPQATWTIDGARLDGDEIALALQASLGTRPHARIVLRRAFCDLYEPEWWAGEWTFRSSPNGDRWHEIEQGLLVRVAGGRIAELRTHNDHATVREAGVDDPLRDESWPEGVPTAPVNPMTREEILAAQMRHTMQGWAQGDEAVVLSSHGSGSLIQTSFETVRGHDSLRRSVKAYFANYADTNVEVHRIVYDGHFLAINQTWSCTNRKTGVRAGDQDLNIGIMREGQFWRWREYYDSTKSAQTLEQTVFGRKVS